MAAGGSRDVRVYTGSGRIPASRLAYDRAVGDRPALEEFMHRWMPAVLLVFCLAGPAFAQDAPAIGEYLGPAYPYELVSAAKADRISWLAYERGQRNVYTAAAPDFRPVRLTRFLEDDGIDLTTLSISADGSVVVFVRGHEANRSGWVANVASNPAGAERAVWAARTTGGPPWRLAQATAPVVSPDGRYAAYARDGHIYRVRVTAAQAALTPMDRGEVPLVRVWGTNGSPRWSPDSSKLAFVSERDDHSFIGVYDLKSRTVTYMAPGVDKDTSPSWSPDSRRIAFIRRPGTPFGMQAQQGSAGIGNPPGPAAAMGGTGRGQQARGPARRDGGGSAVRRGRSGWPAEGGVRRRLHGVVLGGGRRHRRGARVLAQPARRPRVSEHQRHRVGGRSRVFQAEPEEWIRYYSVSVAGGAATPVVLTPGDGMVENVALSKDGRTLFYCTNAGDIDRRHIWKVPTAGGEAVPVTKGEEIETYPAALASGAHVAHAERHVAAAAIGGTRPGVRRRGEGPLPVPPGRSSLSPGTSCRRTSR